MPENTATVVVTFDNRGCQAMLRKYPLLESRIIQTLTTQLENNLFKSKFATTLRWQDLPIRECRVNASAPGAVRIAFVVKDNTATVIYLSRTLQKHAFTTELNRFLGKKSS